ncbi:ERAD-associated E3 ubiquitin-protein ligase HRD1 [Cyberlindnera fabianii]|uniref:ERAD-associated E3 ubiquitin-protein ligase HRD1 n=1 Tax=Cyberlindnera fabianii TaxID=36022 RepID=A0A1V2L706_CYBFA|nr:ERAD-associated E3 ubiquitin-protein ligase HRD1 [Cyberlindnera fabianii]
MPSLSHIGQFVAYFILSNVLVGLTVYPIIEKSPTFFAAGVQLSEGVSMIVLANWLVAVAIVIGKVIQTVLFGELRLIEIEHIYERSRFTALNSLFTLAMFSSESLLVPGFLTLILLFIKVFHWILKDRYEFVFQHATRPSDIILTRNTVALGVFLYVDYCMIHLCADSTFGSTPDVYFTFGFEFAVLFIDLFVETVRIGLNTWEVAYLSTHPQEEVMESKSLYMKILDIFHTTLKLAIHSFLLYTFLGPYRLPLYVIKDIFFCMVNLVRQIKELKRYIKASTELDSRLRDATEEDLADDNNLCIICRDDMTTIGIRRGERLFPKKLQLTPEPPQDTVHDDDVIILPPESLHPPGWTLFRLSNANEARDEFSLHLSDTNVARLEKVMNAIKAQAKEHEPFRRMCVSLAQRVHKTDVSLRMNLLGENGTAKVRPLNENKAIENGANFLSESFVFAVAGGIIIYEANRQRQKELNRREAVEDDIKTLQHEIEYLKKKLAEYHVRLDDYVPPADMKPKVLKLDQHGNMIDIHKQMDALNARMEKLDRAHSAEPSDSSASAISPASKTTTDTTTTTNTDSSAPGKAQ